MSTKRACMGTCAAFALLIPAGAAQAQPGPQAAETGARVEEIVVTARKIEENIQDIPVAVTALTGAALERQNVGEVRDLASKAPGLNFVNGTSSPSSVNPSLRGQTQPDNVLTTDAAVALYVDNVVLPRNYGLRQAMVDVERIEVLRGPQGTLYGKNTTGGLINVITREPAAGFGASLKSSFGAYDAWGFVGMLNIPLGDNVGLRIVGERSHHDGYGHDAAGHQVGLNDSSYIRAKFKGEWDRLIVRAFADYSSLDASGIYKLGGLTPAAGATPEGGRLTQEVALELFGAINATTLAQALPVIKSYMGGDFYDTGGTLRSVDNNYGRDVGLDLSYELTDDMRIRSITGYRSLAFGNPIDLDATPFTGTHPRRAAQDDFISQELQLLGGNKELNWVVGGFASWEHGKEFSTTETLPLLLNPTRPTQRNAQIGKVTAQSYAVFGQFNWQFAPRWSATLGGRYTSDKRGMINYNQIQVNGTLFSCSVPVVFRSDPAVCRGVFSNTFKEPTWTASLGYDFTDDVRGYAKASHGFRSGGQNLRGSVSVESFQPFRPEKVNEYEVGLKSDLFDRSLRLNLAAFYDEITDVQRTVIIAVPATGQTATVQTNAASATVKGVEAEGTWRVTQALTLNGVFSLIDPKYDRFRDFTGDRSGEDWPAPKTQYNLSATYVLPTRIGDLSSTLTWSWRGKQNYQPASKNKSQVTQPGYGLLDARISLDVPDQDVTVAIFGRNLTEEKYIVAAVGLESIGWNTLVIGEPRTYGIEVTKRFGAH